jgi:hypothetical protein
MRTPSGSIKSTANNPGKALAEEAMFREFADFALAVNVRTDVAVPLAGTVIELGLNKQATAPVELEHEKFTPPSKPFTGVTVTLKFAELPLATVAVVGSTAAVKSDTCSCAFAVCVNGALTPVTVI